MTKEQGPASETLRWKNKYFDSLEEFEKKERSLQEQTNLLQRMLVRVSLAAEGQDKGLDAELAELRNLLRNNDATTSALNKRLEGIEKVVVRMDERRADSSGIMLESLEKLTSQLAELDISKSNKKQLKAFSKQIKERLNSLQEYPSLLSEYAALQELALKEKMGEAGTDKSGFFQKLFGNRGMPGEAGDAPEELVEVLPGEQPVKGEQGYTDQETELAMPDFRAVPEADQVDSGRLVLEGEVMSPAEPERGQAPGFSMIAGHIGSSLRNLLEQMIIPESSIESAKRIKANIESGLNWYELGPTLDDLAALVISAISKGQRDFEAFLQHMDERLARFKEFLGESRTQNLEWHSNSAKFDELMRSQVGFLASTVKEATELNQLKMTVSDNLDSMLSHLSSYMTEEEDREQALQEQLDTMHQRFRSMEEETEAMRKRLQEEHARALTDALTELPNREAYEERMDLEFERWQRYGQPLTMVVADIDKFKNINDSYGHLAGDKVIQIMAKELRRRIRKTDFVARYGGEEFVILLPETEAEVALQVMDKTRQMVEKLPFHFRNKRVKITMSFGVSQMVKGLSRQEQFERADKALYQAKEHGRNRVVVAK